VERGFQAMKFEEYAGGFAHVSAKNDARLIRIVREILGEDRDLMIDVQNAWYDVGQAVATCKLIEPYNVFFRGPISARQSGRISEVERARQYPSSGRRLGAHDAV
jgi:hypothetical protein